MCLLTTKMMTHSVINVKKNFLYLQDNTVQVSLPSLILSERFFNSWAPVYLLCSRADTLRSFSPNHCSVGIDVNNVSAAADLSIRKCKYQSYLFSLIFKTNCEVKIAPIFSPFFLGCSSEITNQTSGKVNID